MDLSFADNTVIRSVALILVFLPWQRVVSTQSEEMEITLLFVSPFIFILIFIPYITNQHNDYANDQ